MTDWSTYWPPSQSISPLEVFVTLNPPNPYAQRNDKYPKKYRGGDNIARLGNNIPGRKNNISRLVNNMQGPKTHAEQMRRAPAPANHTITIILQATKHFPPFPACVHAPPRVVRV